MLNVKERKKRLSKQSKVSQCGLRCVYVRMVAVAAPVGDGCVSVNNHRQVCSNGSIFGCQSFAVKSSLWGRAYVLRSDVWRKCLSS